MKAIPIQREKVGEIGTIELEIPIIKIGNGKPKVSIVCGLHGDETTGLFVIDLLLRTLKLKKGQLQVILAANQLAQALKRRESPIDLIDMNRVFPGTAEGSISARSVSKITELLKDSDAILDFHTFDMDTKITGILPCSGEIGEKSLELLELFQPKTVWKVVFDESEQKYLGALGPQLAIKGIPNIAIEFPDMINATEKDLSEGVIGLTRVLQGFGMIKGTPKKKKQLLLLRKPVAAERSGLFIPEKKIMDNIKEGEKIGELVTMNGHMKRIPVLAKESGKLVQIRKRSFVNTGEEIFALGCRR